MIEIERFEVRNKDGSYHNTVICYGSRPSVGGWEQPEEQVQMIRHYQTIDGVPCSPTNDGFQVFAESGTLFVKRI